MSIETRKIIFVREFLKLQDEKMISKLEDILHTVSDNADDDTQIPMSIQEFTDRIDQSIEDSKNGKMIESKDLLAEIEKWF